MFHWEWTGTNKGSEISDNIKIVYLEDVTERAALVIRGEIKFMYIVRVYTCMYRYVSDLSKKRER